MIAFVLALVAAAAADPQGATDPGPPAGPPLSGAALDVRTEEAAALLRCPVCQGLSVADSPSSMARNMKQEVRQKLAAGYDQEQVLASFERSYGEFVRLRPPLRGANWLVWLGPAAFLAAGGAVLLRTLRRPRGSQVRSAAARADDPAPLPEDPRLAQAIRRVRAMAGGSPPDLSPARKTPP
jgi:cytochrome c-type biogenesis protein CcmH